MPTFCRIVLLLSSLFALSLSTLGQEFHYTNYTIQDGLPSNECYSIAQDTLGYIWISTDRGLVRYDGRHFKHYGFNEGLKINNVYNLVPIPDGRIAFSGEESTTGYIMHDSITYFDHQCGSKVDVTWVGDRLIVSSFNESKYQEFYSDGSNQVTDYHQKATYSKLINDSFIIRYGESFKENEIYTFINAQGDSLKYTSEFHKELYSAQVHRGNTYIAQARKILKISPNLDTQSLSLPGYASVSMIVDSYNKLWIGMMDHGVWRIDLEGFNKPEKTILPGMSISDIMEDQHGNFWLATLKDGIIKLSSSRVKNIAKGWVHRALLAGDTCLFAMNNGALGIFRPSKQSLEWFNRRVQVNHLSHIQNTFVVAVEGREFKMRKDGLSIFDSNPRMMTWKDELWGVQQGYLYHIAKPDLDSTIMQFDALPKGYVYTAQEFDDTLYVAFINGVYQIFEGESGIEYRKVTTLQVTCMQLSLDGHILGTKGKGLIRTDRNFNTVWELNKENALSGNFISALVWREDSLFVGSENGIDLVTNIGDKNSIQTFHMGTLEGLFSGYITHLFWVEDQLLIASAEGMQRMNVADFKPMAINPKPVFTSINGTPIYPDRRKQQIAPGTSLIRIGTGAINFSEDQTFERSYRLANVETNWTTTRSDFIEFANLDPGEYQLEFRTRFPSNKEYSQAQISFELLPTITQTWWFKVMLLFGLVALLFTGIYLRFKRLNDQSKLMVEQEQLRFKALTAQLNPHFMFNALGSIQNLILTEQNDLAAEHLSTFSGLVNRTLMNTNELFIPLSSEMEFIEEYIQMEKSRFERAFEFHWKIGSDVDPYVTKVPTMILQPYVENSIIHGIVPLKKPGKIEVEIKRYDERRLKISIIDNGIGLNEAKKLKKKRRRKSIAMENVQARLQSMEKLYNNSFKYEIEELRDSEGVILGTKVELLVPVM